MEQRNINQNKQDDYDAEGGDSQMQNENDEMQKQADQEAEDNM